MSEPFDPHSKSYYRQWFEKRQIPVESEYESFLRSRKIDLLVRCDDEARTRLRETIFAHFRQVNSVEFKGIHDPLTLADFKRIQMRSWGVGLWHKPSKSDPTDVDEPSDEELEGAWSEEAEQLLPSQSTITIVCVTRPDKLLDGLKQELRIQATERSGVYYCDSLIPTWIIHPSELAMIPANYPLLPLARGKTLADFVELCVKQGWMDELQFTLEVGLVNDPEPLWQKLVEVRKMQVPIKEETWESINEFLRLTPEAFEKLPVFREVLDASVRDAEDEGMRIGKQEGIDIGKQVGIEQGKLIAQRQTLLQLLHFRFHVTVEEDKKYIAYFARIHNLDTLTELVNHLLIAPNVAAFEEKVLAYLLKELEQK